MLQEQRKHTNNMSDSVSVNSSASSGGGAGGGPAQPTPTYSRLLALSLRGEWGSVETLLRAVEKGDPEITITDEVCLLRRKLLFFTPWVGDRRY